MDHHEAASAYRLEAIASAPPLKLVRLLYAGALRFLEQAARLDPARQGPEFRDRLCRADAIVVELRGALDHQREPRLCGELERLYLFVEARIADVLESGDPQRLKEATRVLATLSEGWSAVEPGAPSGTRVA
jgi:flagellar protein FliS